ncbi:hypothetical protein J6590_076315 [Homalodisca vitripennis]|nr:hypothetical protein J6590_076315 [Homalodisca vitripennis]
MWPDSPGTRVDSVVININKKVPLLEDILQLMSEGNVYRASLDDFMCTGNNVPSSKDGVLWAAGGDDCGTAPDETDTLSDPGAGGDKLEGTDSAQDDTLHLQRRVGLFSGVALIVGTMIGSGIFVSPSGLLIRTGSVGMSFVIWIACGVLSLLGGSCQGWHKINCYIYKVGKCPAILDGIFPPDPTLKKKA